MSCAFTRNRAASRASRTMTGHRGRIDDDRTRRPVGDPQSVTTALAAVALSGRIRLRTRFAGRDVLTPQRDAGDCRA